MRQKLTNNLGLKILAFVFSIALWFISLNINDPVTSDNYKVKVQLQNVSEMNYAGKYVEVLDGSDQVEVTVRGTRSALASFSSAYIVATADVTKMDENNRVPIEVSVTRGEDHLDSVRPKSEYVSLNVEDLSKIQVPVSIDVVNEPAAGFVLGTTSTAQNVIIVSGPESEVSKVDHAEVEINVENASSDVNISLPVRIYDADNNPINSPKITMSKNELSATATILQTKQLPISCTVNGSLLDGYVTDGEVETDPAYVRIAGKSNTIKNLTSIMIDDAIDITGYEKDFSTQVDIRDYLPDGVTLVDNAKATVAMKVHIEKESERVIEVSPEHIHATNLPDGYSGEIVFDEDDTLTLHLKGLENALSSIDPNALVVMADVKKYMEDSDISTLKQGTIDIPVTVTLPDDTSLKEKTTVTVKITSD